MSLVVLDTNTLIADYWQKGASFRALFHAAERLDITVAVPDLVLDELKGNFAKHATSDASELHSASKKWKGYDRRHHEIVVDPKAAIADFEKFLNNQIAADRFSRLTYPEISLQTIVLASYAGRRPFKPTGDGFKDFILVQILAEASKTNTDISFISHNHRDFADKDRKLHDDIRKKISAGCEIRLFLSLKDYLEEAVNPQLEEPTEFANRLSQNQVPGIELTADGLRSLIENFVDDAEVTSSYMPNLPSPVSDATIYIWDIEMLNLPPEVRRLSEDTVFIATDGLISANVHGFIFDNDYFTLTDSEQAELYVSDPNWNERTYLVEASGQIRFFLNLVFNQTNEHAEAISVGFLEPDEA